MNNNGFQVLKRVTGWKTQLTEATRTAAFSAAAAMPDAMPEQEVSLDLELIVRACDGFQLRYRAHAGDAEVAAGESYHLSPMAAEAAANALFGVAQNAWETVPLPKPVGPVPARPAKPADKKPPMPKR